MSICVRLKLQDLKRCKVKLTSYRYISVMTSDLQKINHLRQIYIYIARVFVQTQMLHSILFLILIGSSGEWYIIPTSVTPSHRQMVSIAGPDFYMYIRRTDRFIHPIINYPVKKNQAKAAVLCRIQTRNLKFVKCLSLPLKHGICVATLLNKIPLYPNLLA